MQKLLDPVSRLLQAVITVKSCIRLYGSLSQLAAALKDPGLRPRSGEKPGRRREGGDYYSVV